MINKFYLASFLILISLVSCVQPVEPKTTTFELDVPYEQQVYSNWCVPTSVLMCAEYFAKDVGWYYETFPNASLEDKEFVIYEILQKKGAAFYPNSDIGAPQSISYFLYSYLDISNENMARLLTSYFSSEREGALRLIREHVKDKKRPLIAIVNESDVKTHAVVIKGVQETVNTSEIKQIYYNDPWYGKRNKSRDEWNRYSLLNNSEYLTLYFDEYN